MLLSGLVKIKIRVTFPTLVCILFSVPIMPWLILKTMWCCSVFISLYEVDRFSFVYEEFVTVLPTKCSVLSGHACTLWITWVCSCYFSFICIVHTPDFHLVSFWSHTWSCWFGCWSHFVPGMNICAQVNLHPNKYIYISIQLAVY